MLYRCVIYVLSSLLTADIFLLYAKLEEGHGLARHAMAVYDRATKAVPADQQIEVCMYVHVRHYCPMHRTEHEAVLYFWKGIKDNICVLC